MKPVNQLSTPLPFWVLRDLRGEFYAYSSPEVGVRCTDELRLARKYGTRKGAAVAQRLIVNAYGKQTTPVRFRVETTYIEST